MRALRWLSCLGLVALAFGCSGGPVIHAFSADTPNIHYGDTVHLSWSVEGARSLSLSGVGEVSGNSIDVQPHATTQYVLTAVDGSDQATSQPVTVTVAEDATRMTFSPSDFGPTGLSLDVPNLSSGEQLAIFTLDLGGADDLDPGDGTATPSVTVQVTGTSPAARIAPSRLGRSGPLASMTPSLTRRLRLRAAARRGHDRIRAREAKAMATFWATHPATAPTQPARAMAAAPDTTSFCTLTGGDSPFVRRSATKVAESPHVIFYVDANDASHYQQTTWQTLDDDWENDIYPDDTQTFGGPSDVDGNGKLIVFFTDALGGAQGGGILMGYYYSPDVAEALDSTPGCTGTGSNHADMFYMNDIDDLTNAGFTSSDVINFQYPDTLGHEFQHLINFNQHAIVRGVKTPESTWINEGLSTMAEDVVGYNWSQAAIPTDANFYLNRIPFDPDQSSPSYFPYHTYYNASLTTWEQDPIGNYAGAHTFFRYFTDRLGKQILGELVQSDEVGRANLEQVLGESFQTAYEDWTTALLFSNETFSPGSQFDFTGASWTPLHQKVVLPKDCSDPLNPKPGRLGYVDYKLLDGSGTGTATLRTDGWAVFVSGRGQGSSAHLTVTPAQKNADHTYVVVVRFAGNLPEVGALGCP